MCYVTGRTTTLQARSGTCGSHDLRHKRADIRAAAAVCEAIENDMQALVGLMQNGNGSRRLATENTVCDMPFVSDYALFQCLLKRQQRITACITVPTCSHSPTVSKVAFALKHSTEPCRRLQLVAVTRMIRPSPNIRTAIFIFSLLFPFSATATHTSS